MFNYNIVKKILFVLKPETAHNVTECILRFLPNINFLFTYIKKQNSINDKALEQTIFGEKFSNPIGLAAGFDKNASMIKSTDALGFAFSEIGTITPRPQEGNAKPRMFRYEEHRSIQNAMGFNNMGASKIFINLQKTLPYDIPIGINLGKNRDTSEEFALDDYKILITKFEQFSTYLVINISSPNTPSLRDLQNEDFITKLFTMAKALTQKPILLKIAPDLQDSQAISLCESAVKAGAAGIIISNTTIDYDLVPNAQNFGGLSGACLSDKSYKLFKQISEVLYGKTLLISVGGISNASEAYKRIKAGASLVQLYTGLIFEGPSIVKNINEELLELLKQDNYTNIKDAIGADLMQKN